MDISNMTTSMQAYFARVKAKFDETLTSANGYTDTKTSQAVNTANLYTDSKTAQTLTQAKQYTDDAITGFALLALNTVGSVAPGDVVPSTSLYYAGIGHDGSVNVLGDLSPTTGNWMAVGPAETIDNGTLRYGATMFKYIGT